MCQDIAATLKSWPLLRGTSKYTRLTVVAEKLYGHIREGGLCCQWPLREGSLYYYHAIDGLHMLYVSDLLFRLVTYTLYFEEYPDMHVQ